MEDGKKKKGNWVPRLAPCLERKKGKEGLERGD